MATFKKREFNNINGAGQGVMANSNSNSLHSSSLGLSNSTATLGNVREKSNVKSGNFNRNNIDKPQQGNSLKSQGYGAFDVLFTPFTANKYDNERHSRSLDPWHIGKGYSFAGPGTALEKRSALGDDKPINSLDSAARKHDLSYAKEGSEYAVDRDKAKHMGNVWEADLDFMKSSFLDGYNPKIAAATGSIANGFLGPIVHGGDPVMGTVASGLIGAKMLGEKLGLLSTKTFSGIDPSLQKTAAKNTKRSQNTQQSTNRAQSKGSRRLGLASNSLGNNF